MPKVVIDPLTRIEGHLRFEADVAGGKVTDTHSSGQLFRGLELILQGRHPYDAHMFTQRFCGVCPVAHATASIRALDMAYGLSTVDIPENARLIRNLIVAANMVMSHATHLLCTLGTGPGQSTLQNCVRGEGRRNWSGNIQRASS
ncbi:MAG: nickel-dependent hydrogenase large subunit [Methanocellales archaeon]|nr:nickel-dependent hydrogenase large subunit [Methanocellales archaeon]